MTDDLIKWKNLDSKTNTHTGKTPCENWNYGANKPRNFEKPGAEPSLRPHGPADTLISNFWPLGL